MSEPGLWPATRLEWQQAADAAYAMIALDSARLYGLVTGGPEVDVERCEQIIERAWSEHRIRPAPDATERLVAELMDEGV